MGPILVMFEEIDEQLKAIKGDQYEPDCSPIRRREIANQMVALINDKMPYDDRNASHYSIPLALLSNGYIPLGTILDSQQLLDIHTHLHNKEVCTSHVIYPGAQFHQQDGAQFNCFRLENILTCPHLLELALRKDILDWAASYFMCTPTLYSMNTWWSRAGYRAAGPQTFHRDMDDFNFLSLFIYLTDVDESAGPHVYIRHTHTIESMEGKINKDLILNFFPPLAKNGYGLDDVYSQQFGNDMVKCTGKAGTAFLLDTYGIHKGMPLVSKDRLVIWLRYGLHKNPPTDVQIPHPVQFNPGNRIEMTEQNKFITRLLFQ